MNHKIDIDQRRFSLALLFRGFCKLCPQCGEGALLNGYLKPQIKCEFCYENFSHISADDGPAWLTLLIVGHAVIPLTLFLGRSEFVPLWVAIMVPVIFVTVALVP